MVIEVVVRVLVEGRVGVVEVLVILCVGGEEPGEDLVVLELEHLGTDEGVLGVVPGGLGVHHVVQESVHVVLQTRVYEKCY